MTKTTTTYTLPVTYAFPPEPDGPVWDKDGNKWEYEGGFWKGPGTARWSVLLRDHGPLTNTEPVPAWPTAALLWHDGEVWTRDGDGDYNSATDTWGEYLLRSHILNLRKGARRFAREAVPVVVVPAAEWWVFRASVGPARHRSEAALIAATDALAGW